MSELRGLAAVEAHYAGMSNNVRALYTTFRSTLIPFITKEVHIEAWGQLCFDDAAWNATAYHMWNHGMRSGWKPVSWRCEMDSEPMGGGKLAGTFPDDFDLHPDEYGHPRYKRRALGERRPSSEEKP